MLESRSTSARRLAVPIVAIALAALVWTWAPEPPGDRPVEPRRPESTADLVERVRTAGPHDEWELEIRPRLEELRRRPAEGPDPWVRLLETGGDARVRRVAAAELAGFPGPETARALASAVRGSADETLRRHAISSLGQLDRWGAGELLDLAATLGDPILRREAARALAGVAAAEDVERIVDVALAEPAEPVRALLIEALVRADASGAAACAAGRLGAGASPEGIRVRALEILARLGRPVPLEALHAARTDDLPAVRGAAVDALAAVAGPEAYPWLRGVVETDPDDGVRERAVTALGRLGPGPARDFLETIARDRRADSRWRARSIEALARAEGEVALGLLEELASPDEPEEVRRTANRLVRELRPDR